MIQSPDIASDNKLRLVLIYALRYQKFAGNAISQVTDMLIRNGVSESDAAVSVDNCQLILARPNDPAFLYSLSMSC